jgi:predicted double-glycine peptidase
MLAASLPMLLGCTAYTPAPSIGAAPVRITKDVRTWQSVRQAGVVRQKWDLSCGSAALSTLFTHHLGDPIDEASVIVWLLQRTDPVKIQSRGGFSLLDLKRFAESRGYRAEGYAGLTLPDLIGLGPAIVPVHAKGYDHFVVVRGAAGDRVVYADPAFGNLSRPADRFTDIWTSGIGFVIYPRGASDTRRFTPLTDDLLLVADASYAHRQIRAGLLTGPLRRAR